MKELNKVFADNLAALRKSAGLTQSGLAEKLNYSDKAVSKWERAEAVPDVSVIMEIAELFGVTVDDLIKERSEKEIMKFNNGKRANVGLIVTLITFMGLLLSQIVVYLSLSGVGEPLDTFLFCIVYPLPLWAVAATVFMALWGDPQYIFIPVFALVFLLTIDAFLLVKFLTGEYFYLIFAALLPAELIVFLSFKLGGNFSKCKKNEKNFE